MLNDLHFSQFQHFPVLFEVDGAFESRKNLVLLIDEILNASGPLRSHPLESLTNKLALEEATSFVRTRGGSLDREYASEKHFVYLLVSAFYQLLHLLVCVEHQL